MKENSGRKEELKKAVKAWYDPELMGFRIYNPDGSEIMYLMGGEINIKDNWSGGNDFATATVKFIVDVVNEKPVQK